MNKLFVPVGNLLKHDAAGILNNLDMVKPDFVFLALPDRIPFGKCSERDELMHDLRECIKLLNEKGYECGVWITTLGFGGELNKRNKEYAKNFTRKRSIDGQELDDAFCPADIGFQTEMNSIVRDIANVGAKTIMLDDELVISVVPGIGCVCKNHLSEYCERVGEELSLEEIAGKVFVGRKNKYRDAWFDLMGDSLKSFCKGLRDAVDEINPCVRMGFCSGFTSWDFEGVDAMELTKILAGNTKPFVRFTGAPYWFDSKRFGKMPLQTIIESVRQQYAWSKDSGIDVFTEADTYPRNRYHVSAATLECFDMALKVSNAADTLKYFMDYTHEPWYEMGYIKAHLRNKQVYEKISEVFDDKKAVGIRIYEKMRTIKDADLGTCVNTSSEIMERWFHQASIIPTTSAIPTVYEGLGICTMAFGENAKDLPEEAFENGLIIDIAAAKILEENGIDTGLRACEKCKADIECFDNTDIFLYAAGGIYRIKTDKKAKVISKFKGLDEEFPSAYLYENSKGQRFLVYAFNIYETPYHSGVLMSYLRSKQINDNIEWLSGSRLPVETCGIPMLYCICKRGNTGLAVGYFNCHADEEYDVKVTVNENFDKVRFINCTGCVENNVVTIDYIKPFGFAGIEII